MWSRPDLKARGMFAFKKNYWAAVAVAVILLLVGAGYMNGGSSWNYDSSRSNAIINYDISDTSDIFDYDYSYGFRHPVTGLFRAGFGLIFTSIMILIALIGALVKIFLANPLEVGGNRFFMENRENNPPISQMFKSFSGGHYGNIVLTMFLVNLFTFLWSLLFIIPGIVKSYEYRMVPYILSENPGMHYKRAFEISKQMMMGQKMETFVLDLSFFGWLILSALTCNILGIFYVHPYINATNAELYAVFRAHAFHTGYLTPNDLPGFGAMY